MYDETELGQHQFTGGVEIVVPAQSAGEPVLFRLAQDGNLTDR
jgi:hypothetical protein